MGVMLSLDRHRPDRGRRRAQHARHHSGLVRGQALASARRYDPLVSARLLGVLARPIRPIWVRRARRPGGGQPDRAAGGLAMSLYPGMSVACLLGECRDELGREVCDVGTCEHECHAGVAAPGPGPGTGRAPAA